jgi:hypothetical protein
MSIQEHNTHKNPMAVTLLQYIKILEELHNKSTFGTNSKQKTSSSKNSHEGNQMKLWAHSCFNISLIIQVVSSASTKLLQKIVNTHMHPKANKMCEQDKP